MTDPLSPVPGDTAPGVPADFGLVADILPHIIWLAAPDGAVVYVNRPCLEYAGLASVATLAGAGWFAIVHPDDRDRVEAVRRRSVSTGEPFEVDYRIRRHDGVYRWHAGRGRPERGPDGRIVRWVGTCTDVDDRVRAEQAVRDSESRYRDLFEANPHPMWVYDTETLRFLAVNDAAVSRYGYSRHEFLAMSLADIRPPEDVPALIADVRDSQGAVLANRGLWRHRWKDGTVRDVEVHAHALTFAGHPARLVLALDVTERVRAEAERDALLARLQLYIERLPLAYVLADASLRVVDWNPAAERLFGYGKAEVLAMPAPLDRLVAPGSRSTAEDVIRRTRAGDMSAHVTSEMVTKDGRVITCEWHNTPLFDEAGRFTGLLCLAQDVTDRKLLEEQLHQSQKMEAVGQLAGGIAHDFNNLLTVINGFSELLQTQLPAGSPTRELVNEIRKAGERSAALTRQLLMFGRRQVVSPRVLDLNGLLTDVDRMLRRLIGEHVTLALTPAPRLGSVRADAGQLQQVILNLAVNARDAMPGGGVLTIGTANAEVTEADARAHPGWRPGRYAVLSVSDTGHGIAPEVRARIFEPFFTTKEPGEGTGLGLAVVHGIVEGCRGFIDVASEPGAGTTFRVYLPRVDQADPQLTPAPHPQPVPRGDETVLLVEDEEAVRSLSRRILSDCGYRVLEASDGAAALRMAGAHAGPIHLLVTDVVMPGLGGRQVAERLLKLQPDAKVLYVSGYTDDAVMRQGILHRQVCFLPKPFSPTALAQKVREILDRP